MQERGVSEGYDRFERGLTVLESHVDEMCAENRCVDDGTRESQIYKTERERR